MVELQPSKLTVRVRFSSPAPIANSALERVLFLCEKSGNEEQGFRRVMKKSYPQVIQKTKKDKKRNSRAKIRKKNKYQKNSKLHNTN